jgi:histidyl-tRNA synthetase
MMRSFELKESDFRVRISDRRLLNGVLTELGIGEPQWPKAYAVLDKLGRKGVDPQALLKENGLDSAELVELGKLNRESVARRFPAAWNASPLAKTLSALDQMGLSSFVDLDLTIVRGLAYYTGTVFEIFDAGRSLRAIAGGGRYDGLLNLLGGVALPAVGFAIGDVVLGELLKDRGLAPPTPASIDAFVAGVTEEDLPFVLRTAHQLRNAGVRVEYSLRTEALGKQLKLADSREAAFAVVIGPDDRAKGEVQLKELRNKQQQSLKEQDLVEAIRSRLTAKG